MVDQETSIVIIYNPRCSKCRGVSELLSQQEEEWNPLHYLEGGLSPEILDHIFTKFEGDYRDLIRTGEDAWKESGHDIQKITVEELKEWILQNPVALQRPIALYEGNVIIARPPERIKELIGT